ncbi:MAG: complex I subunit 1 family protein [Candidatus Limnocylindrales bacterium]
MSAVSNPWGNLTTLGKIVLPLLAVIVAASLGFALLWITGIGPSVTEWVIDTGEANIEILRFVAAATGVLLFTVPAAFVIIYMELKIIAQMNLRVGPDRTGPWGALASLMAGLKVLSKEDYTPRGVDVPVFTLAPAVTFLASVLTLLVIPFAPGMAGYYMELGLLYFFAASGIGVVGLMMAGLSSYNKYSLLGGIRAAAAVVSYELPLILGAFGVVLIAGTLNLGQIVDNQGGWFWNWYAFQQPLALIIFFIAATAEAGRTPFDYTEADSELVAGFATEYSGMRFGFFFFAEYVNVFILSALTVTLFLGGYHHGIDLDPILEFFGVATPVVVSDIDPGQLGPWLLAIPFIVPAVLWLALGGLLWMVKSEWGVLKSLLIGFVLANLIIGAVVSTWAIFSFEALLGILVFFGKSFALVALFVLMRATYPRVRIDQMMNFAWKWLMPAALLNILVTAGAIIVVKEYLQ